MRLTLELDVEENGRIIAEIVELPGVLVYGQTRTLAKVFFGMIRSLAICN